MTAEETKEVKGTPDNQLAMSRMKEEIEKMAKIEADEKVAEAKEQAKEIIAETKKEAESIKKKIIDEAKSEAQKEKVREVSRKKLNIKMDYLETRESMIEEIIVEAQSQLQKFTKSKDYAGFLTDLVMQSGISIGGGDLILKLRTEDKSHFTNDSLKKIASDIEKETGQSSSISVSDDDLSALGGLKMIRSDNKVFVDNTFEKRLERASEETRVALLEVLS